MTQKMLRQNIENLIAKKPKWRRKVVAENVVVEYWKLTKVNLKIFVAKTKKKQKSKSENVAQFRVAAEPLTAVTRNCLAWFLSENVMPK